MSDEEQLSLSDLMPDARPLGRKTDPYTSRAAAAEQTDTKVNRMRARVLLAMIDHGEMTDDDIIGVVASMFDWNSPSSIRTRRKDLVDCGWVEQTGEGVSRMGRASILWALTERGETYVRGHFGLLVQLANQ